MGNRAPCCGKVCPKTGAHLPDNEFSEESSCDPAGAVFKDTLDDLNEVDRLLLQFASTRNLPAVRWLLVLGANIKACDTNGTTSLHAACRTGSLEIVRDLISRGLPLSFPDMAGWAALHVAVHTARRGVVVYLLQRGADLYARTARGLSPQELCNDAWMRQVMASCAAHRRRHGSHEPWPFDQEDELAEDPRASASLRFEPFFVPRLPVFRDVSRALQLQRLGIEIFDERPGQGLAFLVATGSVRDFPIELNSFLVENDVSPTQLGEFLGEDFSLAQTMRLEFINSIQLLETGVVSCLSKVFLHFNIPSDMQKIDRLVDGIAQIWWRQHEQVNGYSSASPYGLEPAGESGEPGGRDLMLQLLSYPALYQLMFSTVMLHWNLYAPLPPSQRISRAQWLALNDGIVVEGNGSAGTCDRPSLQRTFALIYDTVGRAFIPQLQVWPSNEDAITPQQTRRPVAAANAIPAGIDKDTSTAWTHTSSNSSNGPAVLPVPASAAKKKMGRMEAPAASKSPVIDSWGRLLGGFPSPGSASGTITYRHIRSIMCESSANRTLSVASPATSRQNEVPRPALHSAGPDSCNFVKVSLFGGRMSHRGDDVPQTNKVWMTLRLGLLFLASKPKPWAPYAFLSLDPKVEIRIDIGALVLTLSPLGESGGKPGESGGGVASRLLSTSAGGQRSGTAPNVEGGQLPASRCIVFLLPDGRWQALPVARIQVQLADAPLLEKWYSMLGAYCTDPDEGPARQGVPTSA